MAEQRKPTHAEMTQLLSPWLRDLERRHPGTRYELVEVEGGERAADGESRL